MSFEAALEALSSDATMWEGVSSSLSEAAGATDGLTLYSEFSFAGLSAGLAETYNQVREKAGDLLVGGGRETADIADTLRLVRRTYESTDQSVSTSLQGTWDPNT